MPQDQSEHTPTSPDASETRVGPGMIRKSLYMSKDVADRLSAEVNQIHHGSGGKYPKHDVLDAVIEAGLRHLVEVQHRLAANARG